VTIGVRSELFYYVSKSYSYISFHFYAIIKHDALLMGHECPKTSPWLPVNFLYPTYNLSIDYYNITITSRTLLFSAYIPKCLRIRNKLCLHYKQIKVCLFRKLSCSAHQNHQIRAVDFPCHLSVALIHVRVNLLFHTVIE
jgi:hypothetical protein